jgi:ribosomal protein L22
MKKILFLLVSIFLLNGCVESVALLGPATGAANGKIIQSSAKSAFSLGIKKATGKSPLEHALGYAEEKNPNKKKAKCISFIEKTNSEACAIAKKQVSLAQTKLKKIVAEQKMSFKKNFNQARKEGKDSFIFNNKIYNTKFKKNDVVVKTIEPKKSATELALIIQTAIKEKSKIKHLDQ